MVSSSLQTGSWSYVSRLACKREVLHVGRRQSNSPDRATSPHLAMATSDSGLYIPESKSQPQRRDRGTAAYHEDVLLYVSGYEDVWVRSRHSSLEERDVARSLSRQFCREKVDFLD